MSRLPLKKHEGRTVRWVAQNDPEYLEWLIEQDWFQDKFEDLMDEIEEELDKEYGW